MTRAKPILVAALAACFAGFAFATPARAVSPGATGAAVDRASSSVLDLEAVQYRDRRYDHWRDRHRYRRWDYRRHGPRYRTRRPGFTYYYDGYYYSNPWWGGSVVVTPPPAPPPAPVYRDRAQHVSWCLSRYRSYDANSDTYLGYDGLRHRCRSPY